MKFSITLDGVEKTLDIPDVAFNALCKTQTSLASLIFGMMENEGMANLYEAAHEKKVVTIKYGDQVYKLIRADHFAKASEPSQVQDMDRAWTT